MMPDPRPVIFSTEAYDDLARRVAEAGRYERGVVEKKVFPDGERYLRVESSLLGRDAVVIGGTITDVDTLELYDLAFGVVQCGVRMLSLVVPYFDHSTMERAIKTGEVVTAKTRATLLSTIPRAYHANRVLLLDLHTAGIAHYFEGDIHALHLTARPIVMKVARELGGSDFVVGSTDAGRAKWVQRLANDLVVPASFIIKQRLSGDETEVMAVTANVEGKTVVVYDDMIRTGGTLIGAARAYREAGATRVFAIATHGVLPGGALERVRQSGLFEQVVCTDSHPRARELEGDFLRVVTVAPMIAESVQRW
jgi:ribose-phosphate pyrophosphokinase